MAKKKAKKKVAKKAVKKVTKKKTTKSSKVKRTGEKKKSVKPKKKGPTGTILKNETSSKISTEMAETLDLDDMHEDLYDDGDE